MSSWPRNIHLKFLEETHPQHGRRLRCQIIDAKTEKPIAARKLRLNFDAESEYYTGQLVHFILNDSPEGNMSEHSTLVVPPQFDAQAVLLTKVISESVNLGTDDESDQSFSALPKEPKPKPRRVGKIPRPLDLDLEDSFVEEVTIE